MRATPKQLCEMAVQDDIGIGEWNKLKAELDVIYSKRKKRRGPPTDDDRLDVEIDKDRAHDLNVRLYHSGQQGVERCICPACAERRTEIAAFASWRRREQWARRHATAQAQCFVFEELPAQ